MRVYRVLRIAGDIDDRADRIVDAMPFGKEDVAVFRTGSPVAAGIFRADELSGYGELEAVLYGVRDGVVQLYGERQAELLDESAGNRPEPGFISGLPVSLSAGASRVDLADPGDVIDDLELAAGIGGSVERVEIIEPDFAGGDGDRAGFLYDADPELQLRGDDVRVAVDVLADPPMDSGDVADAGSVCVPNRISHFQRDLPGGFGFFGSLGGDESVASPVDLRVAGAVGLDFVQVVPMDEHRWEY